MAATKNDETYVTHVILGVLISIMLVLTTTIVLQKQNVHGLTSAERYKSG